MSRSAQPLALRRAVSAMSMDVHRERRCDAGVCGHSRQVSPCLGRDRSGVAFGWDNEFDTHVVHVPAFDVDVLPVTNAQFLEFIECRWLRRRELWSDEGWDGFKAGTRRHTRPSGFHGRAAIGHGSSRRLRPLSLLVSWRGMFEPCRFRSDWPVYVSHAEACAYARWKGRRLMTEAECHRAAEGSTTGHFDFAGFDPIPVGSHPPSARGRPRSGRQRLGMDLDGVRAVRRLRADALLSRVLRRLLRRPPLRHERRVAGHRARAVRPSFRNWFRGNYPYVYAKFRTAAMRTRSENR